MPVSSITIFNLTLTDANTEYSQALPSFCYKADIKCRSFANLKLAYTSGQSGSTYTSIPAGSMKTIKADDGLPVAGVLTLYLQSDSAGVVVEIEAQT